MKVLVLLATAMAVASSSIAASASGSDRSAPVVKVDQAAAREKKLERKVANVARSAKKAGTNKATKTAGTTKTDARLKKASAGSKAGKTKPRLVAKARTSSVVIDTMVTGSIAKPAAGGRAYSEIVSRYSAAYGVPTSLAHAVISVESNYRVDALGRAGEIGLMQIKPATARMLGYSGSTKGLYDPETNIKYGLKYLGQAHKLGGGTTCGTILRYNAGHAATRMNPISAAYCSKVKRHLAG